MKRNLMKRSTKQTLLVALLIIAVLSLAFGAVYYISFKHMNETFQAEINSKSELIQSNQQEVYVAKMNIAAGEKITEDLVDYRKEFTGLSPEFYITKNDFGKLAVININANVPIQVSMISKSIIEKDLREEEFNLFYLSSNLIENDYVDIRIIYPNGEDYSVLAKKQLKNLSLENGNCFLWLNIEELLRISGAIVDSYLHPGSKLYTVKYIEPAIQEATVVTYSPPTEVIDLIKRDPNVLQRASETLSIQVREQLDSRLNGFYQNYNGEVTWEENKIYSQESSVGISTNVDSSINTSKEENENNSTEEEVHYVD